MSQKVVVAGVGMIQFSKPGTSPTYIEMGADAVRLASERCGTGVRQGSNGLCRLCRG
jgi:sterol carrier protein 2